MGSAPVVTVSSVLPGPGRRRQGRIVVEQDAVGCAIEILELARAQGPQESGKPERAQGQRRGNEIEQDGHRSVLRPSRSALAITSTEELDIATAAISGVRKPAAASGTASRLYPRLSARFCFTRLA